MNRLIAMARALLRLRPVRRAAAWGVRATQALAALAGRAAMLDAELAREAGVGSAEASAPYARLALDPPVPEPAARLDDLPSETTPSERRFLYAFFAHAWGGQADVVELGPFIGGTTRAIALGMLANPRRREGTRLYTYDRFGGYYEPQSLAEYLRPLFESGVLGAREREAVERAGSFGEVFDAVHRDTPYADLVVRRDKPVPDTPEEAAERDDLFALDDGVEVDAAFVDGCKSWYGTKHFMRVTLEAARHGSHLIFQDYGWYTCFWLPAFVRAMGDALVPVASVDNTYAFHVVEPVDGAAVDARFPDTPEELGRAWFDEAFAALRAGALERHDRRGSIVLELQHAAALAYLGERDEARARIARLRSRHRFSELRPTIDAALRSPTYLPGGAPIEL